MWGWVTEVSDNWWSMKAGSRCTICLQKAGVTSVLGRGGSNIALGAAGKEHEVFVGASPARCERLDGFHRDIS